MIIKNKLLVNNKYFVWYVSGSPIPSHLVPGLPASSATEVHAGEDDAVCTNLLLLLQPSIADSVESPGKFQ